jgi:acyl-CoA synthetase (AMP-forming)/AMP-acid ligase II/aryl carrier-like protein
MVNATPAILLSTEAIVAKLKGLKLLKLVTKVPFLEQLAKKYWTKQTSLTQWDLDTLLWKTTDTLTTRPLASHRFATLTGETLAFLQYTSGSTGQPKGVMLSHRNLLHNLSLIYQGFGARQDQVGVIWLPPYHDMGLIGGVLQPLYGGFPCVLMSPFTFLQAPYRWLETITSYHGTISGGPNFAYEYCIKKITSEQKAKLDLRSWRVAFNGAEPINHHTLERFDVAFKECGFDRRAFYPCYGLAEATLFVSGGAAGEGYRTVSVSDQALKQHQVLVQGTQTEKDSKQLVHCGRAAQHTVIVNPDTLERCAKQQVGELWLQSDSVTHGYWQRPEETQQFYHASIKGEPEQVYLRTGDLGFIHEEGVYITGRLKDLLILHGVNYYPQDIEYTVGHCHPHIRMGNCAAFSIEVGEEGQTEDRLMVVCEVPSGLASADYQDIAHTINHEIALHHGVPVYKVGLIALKHLPKTTSGKVRRAACRTAWFAEKLPVLHTWQGLTEHAALDAPFTPPPEAGTSVEVAAVVSLIKEWLAHHTKEPIEVFSADQPLTSYGLDSIAIMQLVQALGTQQSQLLDPMIALEHPTILALATAIVTGKGTATRTMLPTVEAQKGPATLVLSSGQERLWFLHQLDPTSTHYHLGAAYHFTGRLEATYVKLACQAVVHRTS